MEQLLKIDLNPTKLTVKELKNMCKICGMSYSGTKAQCVEKIKIKITEYEESVNIQDSIENQSDSMVANLNNSTCIIIVDFNDGTCPICGILCKSLGFN
jgi:hypothetical protein